MNLVFNKVLGRIVILTSLIIFLARRYSYLSSWHQVTAKVLNVKSLNGDRVEINYEFEDNNEKYIDKLIIKNKNRLESLKKQETINLNYHGDNKELVVLDLPYLWEDMILLVLGLILGLYLYFWACACEECQ